jgi:hypothetical protein
MDGDGAIGGEKEVVNLGRCLWRHFALDSDGGDQARVLTEARGLRLAEEVLEPLDSNGDHVIDFDEFKGWFHQEAFAALLRFRSRLGPPTEEDRAAQAARETLARGAIAESRLLARSDAKAGDASHHLAASRRRREAWRLRRQKRAALRLTDMRHQKFVERHSAARDDDGSALTAADRARNARGNSTSAWEAVDEEFNEMRARRAFNRRLLVEWREERGGGAEKVQIAAGNDGPETGGGACGSGRSHACEGELPLTPRPARAAAALNDARDTVRRTRIPLGWLRCADDAIEAVLARNPLDALEKTLELGLTAEAAAMLAAPLNTEAAQPLPWRFLPTADEDAAERIRQEGLRFIAQERARAVREDAARRARRARAALPQ